MNSIHAALNASCGGTHRVFVYGTLRNGESNHDRLGVKRQLRGYTRAMGFVMVDLGNFPGAVRAPNGGWQIYGEVYDIDDRAFKDIDSLEGYPDFYNREEIDTEYWGKCWIYTLPAEKYLVKGCRFIPTGRWDSRRTSTYYWDTKSLESVRGIPLIGCAPSHPAQGSTEPKGAIVPEARPISREIRVGPGAEEI